MCVPLPKRPDSSEKTIYNRMLELAQERKILVFEVGLPCSMDGHWYGDSEYRIILIDTEKLCDLAKMEYVLAYMLGCSYGHLDRNADHFANKLINLLRGGESHAESNK